MPIAPEFEIGIWNGWWFTVAYLAIHVILFFLVPREAFKRLLTRPKLDKKDKLLFSIQQILYFGIMVYVAFVPLKLGTPWFWIGLAVFSLGMVGYVVAMVNFASTPPDQPVVKGLYRISRNPIHVMSDVAWFGAGIATASWVILVANAVLCILMHNTTRAEERFCLERYGQSYRDYMAQVPRYFLFF